MKNKIIHFSTFFSVFTCTFLTSFSQVKIDTVYVKSFYSTANTTKDSATYYRIRTVTNAILKAEDFSMKDSLLVRSAYYKTFDKYVKEGHCIFYSDGFIDSEGDYKNDEKEGLWKNYYSTGELWYSQTYVHGMSNGLLQGYYKTGEKKRVEKYKKGKFIEGNCYTLAGKDTAYYAMQIMAKFPGGDEAMRKYLLNRIMYPEEARKNGQEGKVFVAYRVLENGSIDTAYVIRSSGYPLLDAAALEVVKNMPPFSPAYIDGVPVKMKMAQIISFKL